MRNSSMTGRYAMDNDELMKRAPSIFAQEPYEAMSERYSFVPTIQIVESMRKEGYQAYSAFEARTRKEEKRGYTKHVVRMRHVDVQPLQEGLFPEILLLNSHDGGCAYQMHAGLFRLVCSNGMIVADATFDKISVRHSGNVWEEILAGATSITNNLPLLKDKVDRLGAIELTPNEQGLFADAALSLKYPETAPIAPTQLLQLRRYDDNKNDLFSVMNRIQENLLKGGLRGVSATNRRTRTRAVKSVSEDTRLNKALWALTEKMAEIKAA